VNTLNKLIEVSANKEKNQKNKVEKKSLRKQINVPAPDNRTLEQPDVTRVARKPV
jgi:hypothetical protein